MAVPASSDVSAGDTILASQYNHLRADAINSLGREKHLGRLSTIVRLFRMMMTSVLVLLLMKSGYFVCS